MPAERIEPFSVSGTLVDWEKDETFGARVFVGEDGRIAAIEPEAHPDSGWLLPGFVDSHVHIESTMLSPVGFADVAVRHGTLAACADPHEIANVLGEEGVRLMIELAKRTPFVFGFGVPSCVPASPHETSGGALSPADVERMLAWPEVTHLSEMMDFRGVIDGSREPLAKIEAAKRLGKPVDGHAPALSLKDLDVYVKAGISTDHETSTFSEALEKIRRGMYVQIRHGSAARLSESLLPLVARYPDRCMFCTDDIQPAALLKSHIGHCAALALRNGNSLASIIRATSVNPVRHYNLPLGLLKPGDTADFQLVPNLSTFAPQTVWLRGRKVAENGVSLLPRVDLSSLDANNFRAETVAPEDLEIEADTEAKLIRVMGVRDGTLFTENLGEAPCVKDGLYVADTERDILKLVVLNRYAKAKPAVGFVKGFRLARGAIASSVSHDSHNLIATGTSDEAIAAALNQVILMKGGLAAADSNRRVIAALPLPFAGLMSADAPENVARRYLDCDAIAKLFGSTLVAPFMTLSFLALPVIPELRLTDRGYFDAREGHRVGLRLS